MTILAVLSTIAAVLIGGLVPMLALAAYTRFRLRRQSRRVFSPRSWRPQAEPREKKSAPTAGTGLSWLQHTIGARPANSPRNAALPAGGVCPNCRYEMTEAAAFCRRCGTRLYRR